MMQHFDTAAIGLRLFWLCNIVACGPILQTELSINGFAMLLS